MSSTNLYLSFDEPLPSVELGYTRGNTSQTKESSTKVKEEDPPEILIFENVSTHISRAETFLAKHRTSLTNAAGPTPEPNRDIRREADAVTHCRSALIGPVMSALNHEPVFLGATKALAEVPMGGLKVDVGIEYSTAGGPAKYVAAIEHKHAAFIDDDMLKGLLWNPADIHHGTFTPKKANPRKELDPQTSIVMQIKQIKAYAARSVTGCKYFALCDYTTLALFKFNDDLTAAHVSIPEGEQFRKALLGWILAAIEDS